MFKTQPFKCNLTFWERVLGGLYLPIHIFLLPSFLQIYAKLTDYAVTEITINAIYYGAGMAYILFLLRRFLRGGFDALLDNKGRCLSSILLGYLLSLALSYVAALALLALGGGTGENPNTDTIAQLAGGNFGAMVGIAVFLGPVVEETLFRGVLFGVLREKNRLLAYAVTILVFAFYHLWQYVVAYSDPRLFLYALQYIPQGVGLCWCYERSGSIWAPIFLHMLINGLSFAAMSML
jgi:membrane protease YdiL (CAAX protease family)